MQKIGDKLKQLSKESIITSIVMILLGVMMFMIPNVIENIISYLIGGVTIIFGIVKLVDYFIHDGKHNVYSNSLSFGIILILVGIICIVFRNEIQSIFRIIIGVFIVYEGVLKLVLASKLGIFDKKLGILSFILALIIITSGLCIVFIQGIITAVIGYVLVAFAIMDIIDSIIFIKNVNKIEKMFNKNTELKVIDAENVKEA